MARNNSVSVLLVAALVSGVNARQIAAWRRRPVQQHKAVGSGEDQNPMVMVIEDEDTGMRAEERFMALEEAWYNRSQDTEDEDAVGEDDDEFEDHPASPTGSPYG
jgi:hypothetical protein